MVVENLIKPQWVVKDPLYALYLGITLSFIGTSIGLFIFPEDASLAGILFTTLAGATFLLKVLDYVEESKGVWHKNFFVRNKNIALTYALFFVGITISYLIWYLILPPAASRIFFSKQIAVISSPIASLAGFVGLFKGAGSATFALIVANNLKLVLVCLVLSLVYGAGAVLIITWNASVLGIFLGSLGRFTTALTFLPHTALEFIGFFLAAMAGGLLSLAFVPDKVKIGSEKFNRVLKDAAILFIIAVAVIIIAALIEVYIVMA